MTPGLIERLEAAGEHTSGPWERLEGVVEVGHPIYKPGTVVTRIVQKRAPAQVEFVKIALVDTGAANARLIAAAPDLLEALIEARTALHQHYVDWDGEPEDAVPLQLAREKCDAAILKARATQEQG